jgi:heme/copper-type cytochrome/quinol oxidase subunit 2
LKYKKYLLFNRNILIGFVCALLSGAATSQIIATRFTLALNSIITLITEDIVFYTVFGILFYVDNKRENNFTKQQKHNSTISHKTFEDIKWIIIKLVSTMSIAEIEYNIVKPYVQYLLLTQGLEPFIASVVASLVGIAGFITVADLMAHYTKLFRKHQE